MIDEGATSYKKTKYGIFPRSKVLKLADSRRKKKEKKRKPACRQAGIFKNPNDPSGEPGKECSLRPNGSFLFLLLNYQLRRIINRS